MMDKETLCYKERVKLVASFFNLIAIGQVGYGIIQPLAGFTYATQIIGDRNLITFAPVTAFWLLSAFTTHLFAHSTLKELSA